MSKTPDQLFQERITATADEVVDHNDPAFKAAVEAVKKKKGKPAEKPTLKRRKLQTGD